ncbi:MAG: hypothetical protein Q9195_006130 [Heterodermia aff. obscurata]
MVKLNSRGKQGLGSGVAFAVLATVAVALRLLAKFYTKTSWATDDSWAIVSLVALFAWTAVEFWGLLAGGGGVNIETIILENKFITLQNFIKSLYILDPLYALTITSVKLSILYLYRRIFSVKVFHQITFVTGAVCVAWWLAFTVTALVPCRPVERFWNPQLDGYCYNFDMFFVVMASIEIVLDVVILSLPVKMVLGLQMSYKRKIMLCAVFSIGGFVVITGIVRTSLTYVRGSQYINWTRGELWTNIHLGTAVLCANLPTYPPLLRNLAAFSSEIASRFSSFLATLRGSSTAPSNSSKTDTKNKHYEQLNGPVGDSQPPREVIAQRSYSEHDENWWEMGEINVKNTIHVA